MDTLLVDYVKPRIDLWARHLERQGVIVTKALTPDDAYRCLSVTAFDTMVLNMGMPHGEALSIADFAIFRSPDISIVAVTSDRFFSDGSLFRFIPNLCSHVTETVPIDDLSNTLTHYAKH